MSKRFLRSFRWFYDYAGGTLTDVGARYVDLVLWADPSLADEPVTVEPAEAAFPLAGLYDTAVDFRCVYHFEGGVEWEVPSREPGLEIHATDGQVCRVGGRDEASCEPDGRSQSEDAQTAGMAARDEARGSLCRVMANKDPAASGGALPDWLDCVRTGRRPISDARAAILCHFSNIALRTGRSFRWDPAMARIADDAQLNRWLTTPYRAPWRW